jgi:hypothetical protein
MINAQPFQTQDITAIQGESIVNLLVYPATSKTSIANLEDTNDVTFTVWKINPSGEVLLSLNTSDGVIIDREAGTITISTDSPTYNGFKGIAFYRLVGVYGVGPQTVIQGQFIIL